MRTQAIEYHPVSDDDDAVSAEAFASAPPGYRRALWAVVLLNVGYGVVEFVGGFIADSQGVKADALDFIGDGSITLLGILAIGWSAKWRARMALLQGIFLALLGVGVLASAAYRVFVENTPEAGLMLLFGLVACAVNITAAGILMKFREGDANVRAVWLFSRNDALGNLALVVGAGLVWVTDTGWPDLVIASVVALLFLQSAWEIIRRSVSELSERSPALT
jgi:cation diffusion facilitator family transporter